MGSEAENKVLTTNIKRKKQIFCTGFVLITTITLTLFQYSNRPNRGGILLLPSKFAAVVANPPPIHVKFPSTADSMAQLETYQKDCPHAKFNVTAPDHYTTKPIWFVIPPNYMSEHTYRTLINTMTGTSFGGKSFVASIRGQLKHCIGKGQSVTCLVSSDVQPDAKIGTFHDKYILLVRNPMTGFPAGYNIKSQKYRGLAGQNSMEEWRSVRDQWGMSAVQSLTDVIVHWNATQYYDIGMYLVYEDLYRLDRSLQVMKNLRKFLLESGFQVVPEEELPCVWYNAIGKDTIAQYLSTGYEYGDYVPGYTLEQKNKMLMDMKQFRQTVVERNKDSELVAILDRYIKDMETNMVLDEVVVSK